MSAALVLLAAAVVVAPWGGPAGARLRALGPAPGRGTRGRRTPPRGGEAFGGRVVAVPARLRPRRGRPAPADALARLLDLLSAALLAGLPTADALAGVADALRAAEPAGPASPSGPAAALRAAAARLRLGADSDEAWAGVPGADRIAPVATVLARATDGGGSVRAALEHSAARMRSEADAAAVTSAERAAVLVAGPLGLCFLPAFVCLGVVPVVVGLADGMLPGVLP